MRESLPKRDFPDLTSPNTGLTEASYRKKFRVGVSTFPMQASAPVAGLCEAGGYPQRLSFS